MNRVHELEEFLAELRKADSKGQFTMLFSRGCELLEFDDDDAATAFDTSRPNASRWRRGLVVPPAAPLVIRFLGEQIDQRIKKVKKIAAAKREASREAPPERRVG